MAHAAHRAVAPGTRHTLSLWQAHRMPTHYLAGSGESATFEGYNTRKAPEHHPANPLYVSLSLPPSRVGFGINLRSRTTREGSAPDGHG